MTYFGCYWDNGGDLRPTVDRGPIAPQHVMKVVVCQCCGCKVLKCSCKAMELSCTTFCKCQVEERENDHTSQKEHEETDSEPE